MSTSLPRPQHLDLPDELVREGRLIHVYPAHPNGKRLIESLLWLLAYYNTVELVTVPNDRCGECEAELVCSGHFMKMELDED